VNFQSLIGGEVRGCPSDRSRRLTEMIDKPKRRLTV
jgi:hypothetical protein